MSGGWKITTGGWNAGTGMAAAPLTSAGPADSARAAPNGTAGGTTPGAPG
jgi:hypothetical protein